MPVQRRRSAAQRTSTVPPPLVLGSMSSLTRSASVNPGRRDSNRYAELSLKPSTVPALHRCTQPNHAWYISARCTSSVPDAASAHRPTPDSTSGRQTTNAREPPCSTGRPAEPTSSRQPSNIRRPAVAYVVPFDTSVRPMRLFLAYHFSLMLKFCSQNTSGCNTNRKMSVTQIIHTDVDVPCLCDATRSKMDSYSPFYGMMSLLSSD